MIDVDEFRVRCMFSIPSPHINKNRRAYNCMVNGACYTNNKSGNCGDMIVDWTTFIIHNKYFLRLKDE